MAEKKNQHYVPQFYLRNFSKDENTIGCCYVDAEKQKFHLSENAPIKSQASKDYYYTKDTRWEDVFSEIEGEANLFIQKILNSEQIRLTLEEEDFLKQYVFFQHIRTPYHANEYESMVTQIYHQVLPDDKDVEIKLKDKTLFALRTFLPRIADIVQPFNLTILDNKTQLPFITSPEPAIFFNLFQGKRNQHIFGIETHGGMFYMPLSARKGVFLYDPLAYRIKGKHIASCSLSDVTYLNMLILDFVVRTKRNLFYFDNKITDLDDAILLMLDYAKVASDLSFVKERFYLFGIPKRRSVFSEEMYRQNNPVSIEQFRDFIRANTK